MTVTPIIRIFDGAQMEFTSPVYELLYFHQRYGTRFPPYWDLMLESDLLKIMPHKRGGDVVGCQI